jgi:hypothetical protein
LFPQAFSFLLEMRFDLGAEIGGWAFSPEHDGLSCSEHSSNFLRTVPKLAR